MSDHGRSVLVATAIVALVVLFDVGRRVFRSGRAPTGGVDIGVVADSAAESPLPALPERIAPGGTVQPGGVGPGDGAGVSYMEQLARAEARRRIRASAALTYLNETIAATGDSMLRRWNDRVDRPVRVFLPERSRAANYQDAFADAVRSAFGVWEGLRLPVRFDVTADSAGADAYVRWLVQFEGERTGQTNLTWDAQGHVQSGTITLATFDPNGRPMGAADIRVVALHEIGHLLGLDHSPDSADLMFPVTKVRDLSRRDIETARLLYALSPGSLR